MSENVISLTDTEVEGMLIAGWEAGKEIAISDSHRAVCVDGEVWRIEDGQQVVKGFVRPTNCRNSTEVVEAFRKELATDETTGGSDLSQDAGSLISK